MSSIAGMVLALWLALTPSDKVNWRAVYVLSRPRVYLVRCGMRQGAGFLYRSHKTIVSSLSVAGCGRSLRIIRWPKDRGVKARLRAYHSKYDLALLEVAKPLQGPPLQASSDPLVSVGQKVALIGHPYHPNGALLDRLKSPLSWSLNVGVLGRLSRHYLQVQIHRVAGYAGAPVLDRTGRVLGMLTQFGPADRPIGMSIRIHEIDALFSRPPPRKGWPFLVLEFHFQARFSLSLGDSKYTNISPSSQELRLDFIFLDQWDASIFVGFDLLGFRTDLNLSVLGGLSANYRLLMPRMTRPYLNYIGFEAGVLFMLLKVETNGKDLPGGPTVDQFKFSNRFGLSFWAGLRFYSIAGQVSLGIFFDVQNLIDPTTPVVPVLSLSWGV